MTSLRPPAWSPLAAPIPWTYPLRRLAAAALRRSSVLLARAARCLCVPAPPVPSKLPAVLEFYADAGAPEGALYLDGELIGHLPVTRL